MLEFKVCQLMFMGFLGGLVLKNLPANARDIGEVGLIPGFGRAPGERNGNWYSCLGKPMDRGTWYATVHGVKKGLDTISH